MCQNCESLENCKWKQDKEEEESKEVGEKLEKVMIEEVNKKLLESPKHSIIVFSSFSIILI